MFRFLAISLVAALMASGTCLAGSRADRDKPPARILPAHEHTASCDETAPEPVQIVCILDRSGSMHALAGDTIGGYNAFLEKQREKPGKAEVTTVLFDDQYEKVVDAVDLQQAPKLTEKEYYARGMTALLDAIGKTVMGTAGRMQKEGICPAKRRVIFLIMTDGKENDSKEFDRASVKAMVKQATEDYHWNFIFMGANIDSVEEAGALGIDARHAADYAHNSAGVRRSFGLLDAAAAEVRESGHVSEDWKK